MPTPPYPLHPEPMQKSWLEQHPHWKIPLGCLTLILLIGVFATILVTIITTSFRSSEVYKQAMARATENLQVRERIGEPINAVWLVSGQLNVSGSTGQCESFDSNLRSKGKGRDSRRREEEWERLAVHLLAGKSGGPTGKHRSAAGAAASGTRLLSPESARLLRSQDTETAFLPSTTQVE